MLGALLLLPACGENLEPPQEIGPDPEEVVVLTPDQLQVAGVEVMVAQGAADPLWTRVPGTVESPDTSRVVAGSVVEGRVEGVLVLEGDAVSVGQALVRIHSHELADWQRELSTAEARLTYADSALERGRRLAIEGAISRDQVSQREVAAVAALADVERARAIVDHLSPDGGDVIVRSPREGTVFRVLVSPGEAVVPGAPLVELGSTRTLWVAVALPEAGVPAVQRGDVLMVAFPALAGVGTTGTVVSLGARVDPVLRSVALRVQLDSIPEGLLVGMMADLHLPLGEGEPGVILPAEAVQRWGGGSAVFVEEGPGRFRVHPVEVLAREGDVIRVTGLDPGLRVVARGAYTLRAVLEGFLGPEDPE